MSDLQNRSISQRTKVLIEKLLLGKFTLAEIAKITGISEQWLQTYVNARSIFEFH
jgi:phage repressor protein C with HTH and peptisase S24 domain